MPLLGPPALELFGQGIIGLLYGQIPKLLDGIYSDRLDAFVSHHPHIFLNPAAVGGDMRAPLRTPSRSDRQLTTSSPTPRQLRKSSKLR